MTTTRKVISKSTFKSNKTGSKMEMVVYHTKEGGRTVSKNKTRNSKISKIKWRS